MGSLKTDRDSRSSRSTDRAENPYVSFWMAGFEGADHINAHAEAQDLVRMTGHLTHLEDDYRRVAALGMRTIRESVGWRLAEPAASDASGGGPGTRFDLSRTLRCADAANRHGVQILWTLMHYGFPAGVDLFADDFADRFSEFAGATARALRGKSDRAPVYTPINEISFLAWAVAETNFIHPYTHEAHQRQSADGPRHDVGWEVKWRLVRAALLAMTAMRAEDPRARFLHVEPLTHVVPPPHAPHLAGRADEIANYQWQAWDMLAGTLLPELGGSSEALDLLGVNYYHNCQWEMETGQRLEWHLEDPRRVSMSSLLRKAAKRYQRPLLIAETSHVGSGRAGWLDDVSQEVERALASGVSIPGICLYPVIDRPDWNDSRHWHNSGMWDIRAEAEVEAESGRGAAMDRQLNFGYAKSLRRAQRRLAKQEPATSSKPHLIVFSHRRWACVDRRPQHLLSRLARDYDIVFVEEPSQTTEKAYLERSTPCLGIEVLRPRTPIDAAGFHDGQLSMIRILVADYLADNLIDDYLTWFCTPMALPLLDDLAPRAVVYDCMDELTALRGAPTGLLQLELALLRRADVVLTVGQRLHKTKKQAARNVVCVPSAVDADHYAPERAAFNAAAVTSAARLQGHIPGPRLGFFGVIDERIDLELVARIADCDASWQVIMVGPLVEIDPTRVPRRSNLHWLGVQSYELLPQLVAGWDVCLMPFALGEAAACINTTNTLAYMAAGKPVVSTRLHEVDALFGHAVNIAEGGDDFFDACRASIEEPPSLAAHRLVRMKECVARHSWDQAADVVRAAVRTASLTSTVARHFHAA